MVQVRSIKRMAQRLLKKNRIKNNSSFKKENNILDKNCDFNATRYEHLKVIYWGVLAKKTPLEYTMAEMTLM